MKFIENVFFRLVVVAFSASLIKINFALLVCVRIVLSQVLKCAFSFVVGATQKHKDTNKCPHFQTPFLSKLGNFSLTAFSFQRNQTRTKEISTKLGQNHFVPD